MRKFAILVLILAMALVTVQIVFADDDELKNEKSKDLNIFQAAGRGNLDLVKSLVKENPSLVNAMDDDQETPLHKAADKGRLEVARFLIEKGAKVNATDNEGETPLHEAADEGFLEMVKLLLANKADINARDKKGHTPLYKAAYEGQDQVANYLRKHGGKE